MSFLPYEDVPLYLAVNGSAGEYIFAENASLNVNHPLGVARQREDNIIRICAFGFSSSLEYSSPTFTKNQIHHATLGPTKGPATPLATSIRHIPKDSPIKFPNGKTLYFHDDYYPDGGDYVITVYSKDGPWSLTEEEAQQGYIQPHYKYITNSPIVGSLDVNFYVNEGNLPHFFNITGLSDPTVFPPLDEERITGFLGEFCFDHAYLKSFKFSLAPNSISQATASFDLYGEIRKVPEVVDGYYSSSLYDQQSVPHGQNSLVLGADAFGQENVSTFSYSIQVERTPKFVCPDINTNDTNVGLQPERVTKRNTIITMSLTADTMDTELLTSDFHGDTAELKVKLKDLNYSSFDDNSNGFLHEFKCHGPITKQSLSVQSAGYLNGSIEVVQNLE
jgi:hypothetical protein